MSSSEMRSIESMANAVAPPAGSAAPPGAGGVSAANAIGRGRVRWLPDTTIPAPATRFDSSARSPVVSSMRSTVIAGGSPTRMLESTRRGRIDSAQSTLATFTG